MQTIETLRDILQAYFASQPAVRLAYLFGSQVSGNTGPMSDVDIGILSVPGEDELALRARLAHEISLALGTDRIDVVLLNHAPIELIYAVIAQGVRLYEASLLERVEFEANALSRYGDYLPVLRQFRTDILKGGENERRVQRYRETLRRTQRTFGEVKGITIPPKG